MSSSIEKVEKALLYGQWDDTVDASACRTYELAWKTVRGDLKDVLRSELARRVLRVRYEGEEAFNKSIGEWFDVEVVEEGGKEENELLKVVIGVACLHAFVQVNWTGPDLDVTPAQVLLGITNSETVSRSEADPGTSVDSNTDHNQTNYDFNYGYDYDERISKKATAELAYGGEPAYHLARRAAFVRVAQILFGGKFEVCRSSAWWRLRTARIHQHVLDEPVLMPSTLLEDLEEVGGGILEDRDMKGRLALEKGLLAHDSRQDKAALEMFVRAARYTGLEYELTGALGKRTKFQQTDVTQLVLLAESRSRTNEDANDLGSPNGSSGKLHNGDRGEGGDSSSSASPLGFTRSSGRSAGEEARAAVEDSKVLPETLALNDDTLLERTEYTSSSAGTSTSSASKLAHLDPSAQPALHPLDQCILLSLCLNVKNTSPSHGLTTEQMKPYIERVISHPRNWSVHTMALLLRSRLEAERTRTVERSALQLQALVEQMPSADSSLSERLLYIHSLPMPSKWELERELALRFLTLGAVRSALEIFERLEMWEEAVKCWQALERPDSGIAIVRDLLEGRKEESDAVAQRGKAALERRRPELDAAREAKLWCLLGDLEPAHAVEHYTRAWEVSSEKSGRAMRSLGGYYFSHGDFARAIECLRRGAQINPLLSRPWFILGCACMREERWAEARDAFARCVAIDEEDAESWNNLATVYLRMGSATPSDDKADSNTGTEDHAEQSKNDDGDEGSGSHGTIAFSNKLLAFRALQIGLKHSYDNWRMWMNYMVVAMDVGEFAEAARAQGRVVEARAAKVGAEAVDEDLLDRLVDAVIRSPGQSEKEEGDAAVKVIATPTSAAPGEANSSTAADLTGTSTATTSRSPNEGEGLRPRVLDLFERVILPRVSSQRIYNASARLLASQSRWEEAVKYYLDAYRLSPAATMEKGGEADKTKWLQALGDVQEIVDVLRNFGPRAEEARITGQAEKEGEMEGESALTRPGKWKMQARSIVRTFMARTRDAFEDDPDWSKLVELMEELKQ